MPLRGLEGSKPGNDFEIVPTLTASYNRATDDPGVVPLGSGVSETDVGVTVRYGITPDITAGLALNPDFSQIEADSAQLDINNQFALVFPEKRPFFLEGAELFSTPIDAVFTRTIASPDVGVKLTGKRGNHALGTFVAQDAVTNLLLPGPESSDEESLAEENTAFVGRYSYAFENASTVGALVTARDGDGYRNSVVGIDGRWRLNDHHTFITQYLRSETEYPDAFASEFGQPLNRFSDDGMHLSYEFDSREWQIELEHTQFGAGFRADSGFVEQVGIDEQEIEVVRRWYGEPDDWWTQVRARTSYEVVHRDDGQLLSDRVAIRVGVGGPLQSWTQVNLFFQHQYDDGQVFDQDRIALYNEMRPFAALETRVLVVWGDRVDFANNRLAKQFFVEPRIEWNVNRNLLLRLDGVHSQLDTKEGEEDIRRATGRCPADLAIQCKVFSKVYIATSGY